MHQINERAGWEIAKPWIGGQSKGHRAGIKQEFVDGKIQILVCNIAAMAEGVDGLQRVCSNEIWLCQDANNVWNQQGLGRLRRDGQTKTVNTWWIQASKLESDLNTVEIDGDARRSEAEKNLLDSMKVRR